VTHELWTAKLDAYLDGELEAGETTKLDCHLRECPGCAAEGLRRLQWKKAMQSAGQRYVADPKLRERLQKNFSREKPVRRWWPAYALTMAVLLLLAGIAILREGSRRERNNQIISELADLHVSTLASSTPVDVVSTDRHTVKPWFAGKIPFTFDLPELQGSPFELVGGRVSYLEQSPGAELIFRVRKHQISVFIFQQRAIPERFPSVGPMDARSFHLATWTRNDLRYFVIGDAAREDIQALCNLLKSIQ
jgi:anti-sigma factor RsiW